MHDHQFLLIPGSYFHHTPYPTPIGDKLRQNRRCQGSGGAEERRSGGAEEQRSGGAEERRSGGAEERRSGGAEEQRSGG
ncbi:MAG: hypothetical protein F6K41_38050, partial [Symploca sp. SIO3E6]|nr:hypothetical protein [Caldora sp. SIO3E6]